MRDIVILLKCDKKIEGKAFFAEDKGKKYLVTESVYDEKEALNLLIDKSKVRKIGFEVVN